MRPRLEHLVQYQVSEIATRDKKQAIVFENGAEIQPDKKIKAAEELVGARLQAVEDRGDSEQLFFVRGEGPSDQVQVAITVDKGNYKLLDPRLEEAVDPHEEIDPNADLPPDPSADRVKEGSTEEDTGGEEEGDAE